MATLHCIGCGRRTNCRVCKDVIPRDSPMPYCVCGRRFWTETVLGSTTNANWREHPKPCATCQPVLLRKQNETERNYYLNGLSVGVSVLVVFGALILYASRAAGGVWGMLDWLVTRSVEDWLGLFEELYFPRILSVLLATIITASLVVVPVPLLVGITGYHLHCLFTHDKINVEGVAVSYSTSQTD